MRIADDKRGLAGALAGEVESGGPQVLVDASVVKNAGSEGDAQGARAGDVRVADEN